MKKQTENGLILGSNSQKITSTTRFDEIFPIVNIEDISLNDKFLRHRPKTPNQTRIRRDIITAKKRHMENFRAAAILPSFYKVKDEPITFYYNDGEEPAVGMTPEWWEQEAKKFKPNMNSRLGNILEYDVFLGAVIKRLVEKENYSIKKAWEITCDSQLNAGNLGPFKTKGKHAKGRIFEYEHIRRIIKGYGNKGFIMVGNYTEGKNVKYTASIEEMNLSNTVYLRTVGWVVLDV